jgi:hypothetical protein
MGPIGKDKGGVSVAKLVKTYLEKRRGWGVILKTHN